MQSLIHQIIIYKIQNSKLQKYQSKKSDLSSQSTQHNLITRICINSRYFNWNSTNHSNSNPKANLIKLRYAYRMKFKILHQINAISLHLTFLKKNINIYKKTIHCTVNLPNFHDKLLKPFNHILKGLKIALSSDTTYSFLGYCLIFF